MNYSTPALAAYESGARDRTREEVRRKAYGYKRDAKTLYYWTFPPTRVAVMRATQRPGDPAATKSLCRAIWADLETARNIPSFYQRKLARIRVLRELFAGECWTYVNQTRRVSASAE